MVPCACRKGPQLRVIVRSRSVAMRRGRVERPRAGHASRARPAVARSGRRAGAHGEVARLQLETESSPRGSRKRSAFCGGAPQPSSVPYTMTPRPFSAGERERGRQLLGRARGDRQARQRGRRARAPGSATTRRVATRSSPAISASDWRNGGAHAWIRGHQVGPDPAGTRNTPWSAAGPVRIAAVIGVEGRRARAPSSRDRPR
jgi:hypothetical protein